MKGNLKLGSNKSLKALLHDQSLTHIEPTNI